MTYPILTVAIRFEQDIVLARQRARQIANLLGFDVQEQTRIATAVSEVARNAFQYAGGGKVEFCIQEQSPQSFFIRISDRGPGIADVQAILDGKYRSQSGMGLGLIGAQRLIDEVRVDSSLGKGTKVSLSKHFPSGVPPLTKQQLTEIVDNLARQTPQNPFSEMQQQNQELLRTLAELRQRQEEMAQLNQELEDTNRGVIALYAELSDKAEDLKRASELKSRFLSYMSHEFRTPLNAITSLSDMLLARLDGDLTPEQEKQVNFIHKSAQSLTELVNDLLDLAKVEAGKLDVRVSTVEVTELFGSLRGILRPLICQNRDVELIFAEPCDSVKILQTDEGKVTQILRNLISNAIKYTERGEIRVAAKKGDNHTVILSVADTGIGIAAENLTIIFEEFTRIDNPILEKVRGTGLGLPLCKKLAELLGGKIEVQSKLGVGSTFLVTLPIVYGKDDQTDRDRLQPKKDVESLAQSRSTIKILMVDDNEADRYTIKRFLSEFPCTILEAANGREGLELDQSSRKK